MTKHIIILICAITEIYSQGCSDAGVCSLPEHHNPNERVYMVGLEQGYGKVDKYHNIHSTNLEFYLDLSKNITLSGFLPFVINDGVFDESFGLGDPIIVLSYRQMIWDKNFEFDLGSRIPVGYENNKTASRTALPMIYQQGLGSFDLIMRIGLKLEEWDFLIGTQIPLSGENQNEFSYLTKFYLPQDRYFDELEKLDALASLYEESFHLKRSMDLIGRIRYKIKRTEKLNINLGLLGVYAPLNSTIMSDKPSDFIGIGYPADPDDFWGRKDVIGSNGLVLNIILNLDYKLSENWLATFEMGTPLISREAEPSGLERLLQANFGIFYKL